jgi:hypothetical protein
MRFPGSEPPLENSLFCKLIQCHEGGNQKIGCQQLPNRKVGLEMLPISLGDTWIHLYELQKSIDFQKVE